MDQWSCAAQGLRVDGGVSGQSNKGYGHLDGDIHVPRREKAVGEYLEAVVKMSFYKFAVRSFLVAGVIWSTGGMAKTPPEKIAELGGSKYTCMGAERSGTPSGVAEYAGKWLDSVPGLKTGAWSEGPYASEQPLFTITASNAAQYEDRLTEGQKALLKTYPDTYKIPVYTSHRDFSIPDWACDVVKKNAAESVIKDNGLTVTGVKGNISFPFPQNGLEAIWNVIQTHGVFTAEVTHSMAAVNDNGSISWGKESAIYKTDMDDPNKRERKEEGIIVRNTSTTILPSRDKGTIQSAMSFSSYVNGSTQAWIYNPGTRRVRQAPEVGFDYPVPPFNLIGVDDVNIFNSSPERFDWTLVGKKEMYVPINNFKIDDQSIKYSELLKKGGPNPKYMRYELHRVWIIQGVLKPGFRHQYSKRVLYVDEDSWLPLMSDMYDRRGILWKTAMQNIRYFPEGKGSRATIGIYNDLLDHVYMAIYMTNEEGPSGWWKVGRTIGDDKFGPKALAAMGR